MKLQNKKTGEIGEVGYFSDSDGKILVNDINAKDKIYEYNSLAGLNAEWEDYEELKESKESKKYWFINSGGETVSYYEEDEEPEDTEACKEIGNYFETKEEAELAVRKLKAWKRLKDKGFKFGISGECRNTITYGITLTFSDYYDNDETRADLDLLFGGEE